MKARLRIARAASLTMACLLLAAARVDAQGWAARAGANVNPDQVFLGAAYEIGPLADRVWLEPGGAIGFGNDATLLAANGDIVYRLWRPRRGPWRLDVGGGPAINHYRLATYSQTEAGVTALASLRHARGWSTDVRVGFLDSPDLQLGVGYRFGVRRSGTRTRR